MTSKYCFWTSWFATYWPGWTSWNFRKISEILQHFPGNFRKISEILQHFPTHGQFWSFTIIQIHVWQVNFYLSKLELGLLVWMNKLKGMLKLYTGVVGGIPQRCVHAHTHTHVCIINMVISCTLLPPLGKSVGIPYDVLCICTCMYMCVCTCIVVEPPTYLPTHLPTHPPHGTPKSVKIQ